MPRDKKKVISSGILILLTQGFRVKYENERADKIKNIVRYRRRIHCTGVHEFEERLVRMVVCFVSIFSYMGVDI